MTYLQVNTFVTKPLHCYDVRLYYSIDKLGANFNDVTILLHYMEEAKRNDSLLKKKKKETKQLHNHLLTNLYV
jgi:phage-related protein